MTPAEVRRYGIATAQEALKHMKTNDLISVQRLIQHELNKRKKSQRVL